MTLLRGGTQIEIVRDYPSRVSPPVDFDVVDVMRACIAAPTYFKPVEMGGETYIDGGLGGYNPAPFAVEEARRLWDIDPDDMAAFVSLGSGIRRQLTIKTGPLAASMSLVRALAHVAQDSEADHQRTFNLFQRGRNLGAYYRFNVAHGLENIAMDDAESIAKISELTSFHQDDPFVKAQTSSCVQSLASRYVSMLIGGSEELDWTVHLPRMRRMMQAREKKIGERIEENLQQRNRLEVELSDVRSLLDRIEVAQLEDFI